MHFIKTKRVGIAKKLLLSDRKAIVHILQNKKGWGREEVTSETLLRDTKPIVHILQKQN